MKHITVTFEAYPFHLSNKRKIYPADPERFPDVNLDGQVTVEDVSEILQAVAKQLMGEPTGLSPEQELRADADRDGEITTEDASLVLQFMQSGKYIPAFAKFPERAAKQLPTAQHWKN